MPTMRVLSSVAHDIAHHAASGMSWLHPHACQAVRAEGIGELYFNLLSPSPLGLASISKPLRASSEALQRRFIEILGRHQHAGTAGAGVAQQGANCHGAARVEAARRIERDHQPRLVREFASKHQTLQIAAGLIRFSRPENAQPLEPQRATLGEFCEPESGRVLDQVVVTYFRKPHSYTAEDVVEVACHGAPVILRYLVECCLERGARAAEPGEFTMRAFLNGRIDLTQAEAVRDLIESRTLYQARVAAQQMEGAVSARLKPHKKALLDLMARLEAGIDFAEDDVPVSGWDEILSSLDAIQRDLEKLANDTRKDEKDASRKLDDAAGQRCGALLVERRDDRTPGRDRQSTARADVLWRAKPARSGAQPHGSECRSGKRAAAYDCRCCADDSAALRAGS